MSAPGRGRTRNLARPSSSREAARCRVLAPLVWKRRQHAAPCPVAGGSRPNRPRPPRPARSRSPAAAGEVLDVDILNGLLDNEHMAIAAYTAAIPLLGGHTQRMSKRDFLNVRSSPPRQSKLHGEPDHAPRRQSASAHARTATTSAATQTQAEISCDCWRPSSCRQIAALPGGDPARLARRRCGQRCAAILGSEAQHVRRDRPPRRCGKPIRSRGAFVTGHE